MLVSNLDTLSPIDWQCVLWECHIPSFDPSPCNCRDGVSTCVDTFWQVPLCKRHITYWNSPNGRWSAVVGVPYNSWPHIISPILSLLLSHRFCNIVQLVRAVPTGTKAMRLSMINSKPIFGNSCVTIARMSSRSSGCAPNIMTASGFRINCMTFEHPHRSA